MFCESHHRAFKEDMVGSFYNNTTPHRSKMLTYILGLVLFQMQALQASWEGLSDGKFKDLTTCLRALDPLNAACLSSFDTWVTESAKPNSVTSAINRALLDDVTLSCACAKATGDDDLIGTYSPVRARL
jgi:hypothetical protein